jgi:hypothetical protein
MTNTERLKEVAAELSREGNKIGLVGQVDRVGVPSFSVFLEYRLFTPCTPQNDLLDICLVEWERLHWVILVFHKTHLPRVDELMKTLGLRRADGVPTMITHKGVTRFPANSDNVFTIENIKGHFTYRNDLTLHKTAQDFEMEAIDREFAEFFQRQGRYKDVEPVPIIHWTPKDGVINTYVITERPKDYPHSFVVRRHEADPSRNESRPTNQHCIAPTLDAARRALPPGLGRYPRDPNDDAVIVEYWL